MIRAALVLVADTAAEAEELAAGRGVVVVETAELSVEGEMLKTALQPVSVEALTGYALQVDDTHERTGPLVRLHSRPAEESR